MPGSETQDTENSDGPTPISSAITAAVDRMRLRPQPSPEQIDRDRKAQEQACREEFVRQIDIRWKMFVRDIGERYAECTLDNYQISKDSAEAEDQSSVVERLRRHVEKPTNGKSVVFFGPAGTGKDHLMVALCRAAIHRGAIVKWVNGMDLYGDIRDAMDSEKTEASMLAAYTEAGILAISDPLPPWGDLTQHQAGMLFRIIDRRYRDCKATWMTANFSDGEEASKRLGVQIIDRMKDGAITLSCDWKSYRKSED